MPELQKFKINPLTLILLIAIVVIPIALIIKFQVDNLPLQSDLGTDAEAQDLIPVLNAGQLTFGSTEVVLPDGWVNVSRYSTQANTKYDCVGSPACQFGVVADIDNTLDSVAISFVNPVKEQTAIYTDSDEYPVKQFGEVVNFSADKAVVLVGASEEEEGTEEVSDMIVQLSGCFSNNVCISSGVMDVSSQEANDANVKLFFQLVHGIQLIQD